MPAFFHELSVRCLKSLCLLRKGITLTCLIILVTSTTHSLFLFHPCSPPTILTLRWHTISRRQKTRNCGLREWSVGGEGSNLIASLIERAQMRKSKMMSRVPLAPLYLRSKLRERSKRASITIRLHWTEVSVRPSVHPRSPLPWGISLLMYINLLIPIICSMWRHH